MQTRTRNPARKNLRLGALAATALLALFSSRPARAVGELTGRIAGYVYDPTGAALSEVPISLAGSLLASPVARTTGDDGKFEFDNLPPGEDYVLEVNVPGFTPIRQTGVRVRLGQTTTADVNLTVMTETQATQTFQIIEKVNPIINPDSAQAVAVVDAEKASTTPIFHQVEGMAQQVAGVGPGNRPSTRGGLARHGKFYVDGLDTTDVTDGSITAPMNFDAVQNFEIIVGGMDAQYNSMGMITNAVTKNGTNKFTYDVSLTFQPKFLAGQPNYPASNPDFFGLYTNNDNPGPQTSFYSPIVNLGGPIIPDKLWFYASYQQNFSSRENPISLFGKQSNRPTDTTTSLGRIKITWQATSKDRVNFGFNLDRNVINNNLGNSGVTDDAENKIDRGGEFFIINYDHSFDESTLFQLQTGITYKGVNTDPIHSDFTTISHYDAAIGVTQFNSDYAGATTVGNYLHETKWRIQFDPTISWKMRGLGTHQLKAGVQTGLLIDQQATGVSGNRQYTDYNGVCNDHDAGALSPCYKRTDYGTVDPQTGLLVPGSLSTSAKAVNFGAFIQDRWNVNRRLTIVPGFRLDLGRLYGDNGNLVANLVGIGPRLSATYDLLGDRKTLLSGHYGRSNDVGNILIAQHANDSLTQVTSTFSTSLANPNLPGVSGAFPDCKPYDSTAGCFTAGGPRDFYTHNTALFQKIAPNPHVDEFSVGIKSEVVEETVLGLDYTYRYYGNMWADQEVNRIWDVSGTKILGYVDPRYPNRTIYKSWAPDSAYRRYHGLDFWVQGTPGRWDLLASYTLAFNNGTVDDYFGTYLQNPRMTQFYDGPTSDDRRHTIKGSISYKTPFGLDLGFRIQYRTGSPEWESFTGANSERIYRSPRGTGFPIDSATGNPNFNDPNSWAEMRNPETIILDLQARYNFQNLLRLKQRLELVLLVVNSLNDVSGSQIFNGYYTSKNRLGFDQYHNSALQAEFIVRFRN